MSGLGRTIPTACSRIGTPTSRVTHSVEQPLETRVRDDAAPVVASSDACVLFPIAPSTSTGSTSDEERWLWSGKRTGFSHRARAGIAWIVPPRADQPGVERLHGGSPIEAVLARVVLGCVTSVGWGRRPTSVA